MCSPEMGAGNCVSNGRVSMKLLGGEVALLSKALLLELLKLEKPLSHCSVCLVENQQHPATSWMLIRPLLFLDT